MANYVFNSPNLQGVNTPSSGLSPNANLQPAHSPVVSYVVPSNLTQTKVVSSPNVSATVKGFSPSQSRGAENQQNQREISTVYLPPIRYRYDNATGTLVQVEGPTPTANQVQSPLGSVQQNLTQPNQFVQFNSSPQGQTNPLSQSGYVFNQNSTNPFYNPTQNAFYNLPQTVPNQPYQFQNYKQNNYVQFPVTTQGFPPNQQYPNNYNVSPPVFVTPSTVYGNQPGFDNQQYRVSSARFGNVPNFGNPQTFAPTKTPENFRNYNNNLYMDTPKARYEAAVKEYYDRMNGNFQNYNPNPETPKGLAQAFSAFENVASKFFSNTDEFVSDFKNAAFKMFNQNSPDYLRAAVFKLQRLENVPVNPKSVSKLSFNVVAYFDPNTENYDSHKSEKQWALPTSSTDLVDCDLKGEVVKIPWKGEEFVFLKIVEHIGQNRFVLGRLQLKLDTLVTGRPLRVTIIGDDGHPKGDALLEFAVGAVTLDEFNKMNVESQKTETYRKNCEDKWRNNRMPGYDRMLQERNEFEANQNKWPQTVLKSKKERRERERCNLPGPFNNLVSWCCDITDQDLE